MVNDQQAGAKMPTRTGSMVPPMPSGMVSPPPDTAIGAQTARPLAGQPGTQGGWKKFGRNDQTTPSPESLNKPTADGPQKVVPAPQNAPPPGPAPAPQGDSGGWRRFSAPLAPTNLGAGGGVTQGQGGWNHFKLPPKVGSPSAAPREGGYNL
jgi:hypothetical protein